MYFVCFHNDLIREFFDIIVVDCESLDEEKRSVPEEYTNRLFALVNFPRNKNNARQINGIRNVGDLVKYAYERKTFCTNATLAPCQHVAYFPLRSKMLSICKYPETRSPFTRKLH